MPKKHWKGSAPHIRFFSDSLNHPSTAPGWQSSNWSGYAIQKSKNDAYRSISGYWRVPRVRASRTNKYSSAWIGIDGYGNTSLIQTGTEQDYANGKALYYPWWEILPAAETKINKPVSPGDWMYARISKRTSNKWLIVLANRTKGWIFRKWVTYTGPGRSAEWIMEAPSVNGKTTSLARYETFPFFGCRVNRNKHPLRSKDRGVMLQNDRVVSTPSLSGKRRNAFVVAYGARTPAPPR